MPLVILDRNAWGANPSHPRLGALVAKAIRTEVFIHHTVIPDNDSTPNEWETIDEVKKQMKRLQTIRPDLGLDVPYNMVAFCMANGDLVLGEGRGTDRSGAHTVNHNRSAIAVSFHGNFMANPPAHLNDQLSLLSDWLRDLRDNQGFINLGLSRPAGRDVFGHREVKSTNCPGDLLFNRLNRIRFL